MSSMPAAASASASLVFCTQTPTAPAAICRRAMVAHLCIFACGRRRTPWLRANAAMVARLRSIASRSITSAGVSIDSTGSPTCGCGAPALIATPCGACARPRRSRRHLGTVGQSPSLPSSSGSPSRCAVSLQPTRVKRSPRVQQPVDRGVAELPRARRREVEAGRGAVQAVEHAAVADDAAIVRPRARAAMRVTAATARALNSTRLSPPSGANAGSWRRQRAASAGQRASISA